MSQDWVIAVSDNGWTNDKIGLVWLKNIFNKHTQNHTVGKCRFLISTAIEVILLQNLTNFAWKIQLSLYVCYFIHHIFYNLLMLVVLSH